MASPTRGVPVTLDRERHLRYPIGALKELADADMVEVLHAGLVHEDADLTVERVGEMIDLEMLPELAGPVKKATGGMIDLQQIINAASGAAGKAVAADPQTETTNADS